MSTGGVAGFAKCQSNHMEFKLAALKGFRKEGDVIITSVPYEIGRSKCANFIIPHMNVSRKHCQIVSKNGLWSVKDWSSSGTFINDILVGKGNSEVIRSGDSIRLGPVESELCWTFHVLPDRSFVESGGSKCRTISNSRREKERPSGQCRERKKQQAKKNPGDFVTTEEETESEVKGERELRTQNDGEEILKLQREIQQMQSALNSIEEQNCVLQEKLANEMKNRTSDLTAKILENLTDVMETEMQCTICSELFVTAVTLCCSHTFCKYCIDQWKKKQKTCPICRKKIMKETRSLVVDNYIDKMVGTLSLELKHRRDAIIKERNEVPTKKQKCNH